MDVALQRRPGSSTASKDNTRLKLLCYCMGRLLEQYESSAHRLLASSNRIGTCFRDSGIAYFDAGSGNMTRLPPIRSTRMRRTRIFMLQSLRHSGRPGRRMLDAIEDEKRMLLLWLRCYGRSLKALLAEGTMEHLYDCKESVFSSYRTARFSQEILGRSALARVFLVLGIWLGPNLGSPEYPRRQGKKHDELPPALFPLSPPSLGHAEEIIHYMKVSFNF